MEMIKNAVGRNIPSYVDGFGKTDPFMGVNKIEPSGRKAGAKLRMKKGRDTKLVSSLKEAIKLSGLKNGMTISFHHHMRNGDYTVNMVLDVIADLGIKDLTLAPSSLGTCHGPVINHIETGLITGIQSSGLRDPLGTAISQGILPKPVIIRSHGGRARAIEDGELHIDVAFIAAPSCDPMGNINGRSGKSACGSMGYAMVDAQYADCVIAITDNLVPFPNLPASVDQTMVDYVVEVDCIGDPKGIVSGPIRFSDNPRDLLIATNAVKAIVNSGFFADGFVYQTGAAGASLAVTSLLREEMLKRNIKGALGLGGITSQLVTLLEEGLMSGLYDTQSFDLDAVRSIGENPRHYEISASFYANPNLPAPAVNNLDFVMLGALEIDTDFNVNVMTRSDGVINQAIGGHQDTAVGARMSVILAPLIRSRIPIIVDKVTTVCTPGEAVDVICTDYGIAVNPNRQDIIKNFQAAGLPIRSIEELQALAENLTGKPDAVPFTDRIVGLVEYRDGSIIDIIYQSAE
ncbi:citrate lyase subunit alpha [Treponema phagedenis]|uniref:Citrate lyase alpha chain n=1 Tax=Treponema phagedenis TaxID=162 RepID=A0AAE6IU37_TREPH|nr:citrate lyase subunit alpha [Treponema phagedenis]QEJ94954.1 citrate lyase subunit alpha [Treponema phagedenis]QEJ98317.1 citrate lyase subunit alpha [Treponema phagedenis]QEK00857.1 citrate lyase subunit alpha [Treponema phagedenis]QEK03827.1 citrate lyase subunit alpha [Treponema phagedenis]QEK05865.1 citrate lyase subunit alpha [Treponema phagedenis]